MSFAMPSSPPDNAAGNNNSWLSVLTLEATVAVYVLSGVCQPLLMTVCKEAGLANPTAQLYMVFYYLGPGLFLFKAWNTPWPSLKTCALAMTIACLDVFAQAMNYTGTTLCGPTIFAICYSSVTVWTAVWARCVLRRQLSWPQWLAVALVFGGLTLTASDTSNKGPQVAQGTLLVVVGSALHAGSYVWSEYVLLGTASGQQEVLTVEQNTGLQCWTASSLLGLWQLLYTVPRWDELLGEPVHTAGTSWATAWGILAAFGATNLVHAYTFFYTIKHYKGGSVTAGVLKGLQAVLVFCATHVVYCGRVGGSEMCISVSKLASLVTVVSGVTLFSWVTPPKTATPNDDDPETKQMTTYAEEDALLLPKHTSGSTKEGRIPKYTRY